MNTTKTTKTTKGIRDPTFEIIGCAIEVHRRLGPGLLESAFEQCFAYELAPAPFGLLMNFNAAPLKHGIQRFRL